MVEPKFKVGDRVVFIPWGDIVANPVESRPQGSHGAVAKCRDEGGWFAYDVQLDGSVLQMFGERVLVAEPVVAEELPAPAPVEIKRAEPEPKSKPQEDGWSWHNPAKEQEEMAQQWEPITAEHFVGARRTDKYAKALPKKERT